MNRDGLGRWLGTVVYVPLLYGGGWLLARPLGWWWPALRPDQLDLAGAGIALGLLLLSLPRWVQRRWQGGDEPWHLLGLRPDGPLDLLASVAGGLGRALLLLGPITALMLVSGQAHWHSQLSPALVGNGLILGLGVGFAEELLFRGWLLGELDQGLGLRRAELGQAVVFGLLHPWSRHGLAGLPLLLGLVLLGLLLSRLRLRDRSIWGAVALHGGLVGGWFALQQGGLIFQAKAAGWLWGPGLPQPNPIGGLPGLVALATLLMISRR